MSQTHPHPEWRIIVDLLHAAEYGAQFSHAQIAAATGLPMQSLRYFQQVRRARRALLEDWRRWLEPVKAVGYRLVEPTEFHGSSRRQVILGGRRIRQAARILVAAPSELLSDGDNRKNADALAKIGALESQRRKVMAETRPSLPAAKMADQPKLLTA